MHLKRLEAFGFKSFADKVTFDFEPGFTIIVGPNGCGKSNVVDSVKWVLGEQSAKSLRGGEMMDVIFNGSAHRKPLNFAEVVLTFDNACRTLPLEMDEVSVSRRLYRSGESEYLINNALCRLRDVRELFFDTGIGTSSYSIIEQGRIAMLLEANSKERRMLFEEAAGIHKYKERRKVAQRKLERVEANLARLHDVLGEVDTNLRKVTRQAERARQAQEIGEKLRATRLDLLLHEIYSAETKLQEAEGSLSSAEEGVQTLSVDLGSAQTAAVGDEERLRQIDSELSLAQQHLSNLRSNFAALEEAIRSERRAVVEMRNESERARQVAKEAAGRAGALASERERAELDLERTREELSRAELDLKTLESALNEAREQYAETVKELEKSRKESTNLLGKRSQHESALSQVEADLGGIDYRIRKAHAAANKAEDLLRFARLEAEEVQRRAEQTRRRRETLESELSGIRSLQIRTEEEIERLGTEAQELRNQSEMCRSRVTVLDDLIESGEGLTPGARAALNALRNNESDEERFYGLVADCLQVEPQLETAIETALGNAIEALTVGSATMADRLLEQLSREGLGRATLLPLDRIDEAVRSIRQSWELPVSDQGQLPFPTSANIPAEPGCLGSAAQLVGCEEVLRPMVDGLLGDVLVFTNREEAAAAYERAIAGSDLKSKLFRRVTLQGDLFEPTGSLSGGKQKVDRLGPIGRRNEIQRLNAEMDRLRHQIEGYAERTAYLEKRAQKLARDDERISANLAALNATATELKGVLGAIAREEARSAEEKKLAVDELRELDAERESLSARIVILRNELEELKRREVESGQRTNKLSQKAGKLDAQQTERRTALEERRREVSTLGAKLEGLIRHEQSLSAQFAERRDEADREARRADALDDRCQQTEDAALEKERQREETAQTIQTLEAEVRQYADVKEQTRQHLESARAKERTLNQQLDEARRSAAEIQRRQIEFKLRRDTKIEQARNDFQIDPLQLLAARGGPPEVTPQMQDEARELEQKLQRIGPVNMYALEEQKQLEERLNFLQTQSNDLESARNSLRDVMARINRRSRQQFQDTFEAVRGHFQEIFRKLFGGGKADLVLEEEDDILEAGIDIQARPPGKEPRSIMQLSGGEKALTTIALLFAVFRSRPAPFCILDEVDAPLDEANVDRFNQIVREFMDRSQFVVITHNKKTMSYGDILYGVTMPEPGVSKRIAMRFDEIEKHLDLETIAPSKDESHRATTEDTNENTERLVEVAVEHDELASAEAEAVEQ